MAKPKDGIKQADIIRVTAWILNHKEDMQNKQPAEINKILLANKIVHKNLTYNAIASIYEQTGMTLRKNQKHTFGTTTRARLRRMATMIRLLATGHDLSEESIQWLSDVASGRPTNETEDNGLQENGDG